MRDVMTSLSAFAFIAMLLGTLNRASAASEALDMTITATILTNQCAIHLDSATVVLPTVIKSTLDEQSLSPADYGEEAAFQVNVTGCESDVELSALHFSIQPASGAFPAGVSQVFANDVTPQAQGAAGVGVVIFSHDSHQNVLNSDGTSDVMIPTTQADYQKPYQFDVRYQKIGNVSAGAVSSALVINVEYQ